MCLGCRCPYSHRQKPSFPRLFFWNHSQLEGYLWSTNLCHLCLHFQIQSLNLLLLLAALFRFDCPTWNLSGHPYKRALFHYCNFPIEISSKVPNKKCWVYFHQVNPLVWLFLYLLNFRLPELWHSIQRIQLVFFRMPVPILQ